MAESNDGLEASREYVERFRPAPSGPVGTPGGSGSAVPGPLTNPNLFGGLSVDPGGAVGQPMSPWSTLDYGFGGGTAATEVVPGLTNLLSNYEAERSAKAQGDAVRELEMRLDADLQAVQDADFDKVQDFKTLAEMAITAVNSEDEEFVEFGRAIMHQLKDVDEFRTIFPAIDSERNFEDYYVPPKEPNFLVKGFAKLGQILDGSSQWGLGMFVDLKKGEWSSARRRVAEGSLDFADFLARVGTEVSGLGTVERVLDMLPVPGIDRATDFVMPDFYSGLAKDAIKDRIEDPNDISYLDRNEDGRVDFIEAAEIPEGWGEDSWGWKHLNLNNIVNLAGEMALDPMSYVTLGTGGAAGRGAKGAKEVIEELAFTKGDDYLRRGLITAPDLDRLRSITTNLMSNTPWKKFAKEGDKEFLRRMLELDVVSSKSGILAREGGELSAKQVKHLDRMTENVARRTGGGAYFGVGQAYARIPGTRAMSQGMQNAGLIGQRWGVAERAVVNDSISRMGPTATEIADSLTDADFEFVRKAALKDILTEFEFPDPDAILTHEDAVRRIELAGEPKIAADFTERYLKQLDSSLEAFMTNRLRQSNLRGRGMPQGNKIQEAMMMPETTGTPLLLGEGILTHNPALDRVAQLTERAWKPFSRVARTSGDIRQRVVRQFTGDITTRIEADAQRLNNVLQHAWSEATDEVMDVMKFKSRKEAEKFLAEQVDNIRSFGRRQLPDLPDIPVGDDVTAEMVEQAKRDRATLIAREKNFQGRERAKQLQDLTQLGRHKTVNLVNLIDRVAHHQASVQQKLGRTGNSFLFPLAYQPRQISGEAVKFLNKVKKKAGAEWEALRNASAGEAKPMLDEWVKRGLITSDEAEVALGALLADWMERAPREIIGEATDPAATLQTLLMGQRSGKARTFMPRSTSIMEVNDAIAEMFAEIGKKGGPLDYVTEFYDIDPVDAWVRQISGFTSDLVIFDFLEEAKRLTVGSPSTGQARPAVIEGARRTIPARDEFGDIIPDKFEFEYEWADPTDGVKRIITADSESEMIERLKNFMENSHYQVEVVGHNKFYLVDSDVMFELNETVIPRIKRGATQTDIMRIIDQMNGIWAAHATVPLIGTAFHAKNHIGNWFLMAMAGFKNPKKLVQAADLQAVNKAVQRHMVHGSFDTWDAAANDMLSRKLGKTTIGRVGVEVTRDKVNLLKQLEAHGTISGSFFSDLKTDRLLFSGTDQRMASLSVLIDNKFIGWGQNFGATIENNARMALFLDGIDKGLTPAAAGSRVKKFLFDYSDLTPFEDRNIRSISRFYTFMRKNTELQMRMLVSQPGTVWNTQKLIDAIIGGMFGDDGDPRMRGIIPPQFAEEAGFLFNASDSYMHRYETPLISAVDTLQKVFSTAALIPGFDGAIPEELQAGDTSANLRASLGLLASGPTSFVNYFYEGATGTDLLTGNRLVDSNYARVLGLVETMLPSLSKAMREFERFRGFEAVGLDDTEWGAVSEHQEGQYALRFLNSILGLNVYALTEEQQARTIAALTGQYSDMRRELKNEGYEVPTLEELRNAGRVADANRFLSALFFASDEAAAIDSHLPGGAYEFLTQELGVDPVILEDTEKPVEQLAHEAEQIYEMVEYRLGRELTQTERWMIGFRMPGVPSNPELEAIGLNPYRENQFIESENAEANIQRAQMWLEAMAPVWGMTPAQAVAANPLLSEAQIYMSDALGMGMSPEEAMRNYIAEMGRTRRAQIFGVDSLEEFDYEKSMTNEQRIALNRSIWEDAMQYMTIAQYFGLPMDEQSVIDYINYGADRLLQGERELLGIPRRQSIPNREDPRSDAERQQEAQLTYDQIVQIGSGVANTGGPPPGTSLPPGLFPG